MKSESEEGCYMKMTKWLASFTLGAIILFVTLYLVISLCIAYFKLTGVITDGQLFFDLGTPAWSRLLTFQAACVAILWVAFFLRSKLRN